MIIDISNSNLFTDEGGFIKALHCPKKFSWNSLQKNEEGASICKECSKVIYDTSKLTDEDMLKIVEKDASACFALSPRQSNVSVSLHPMQNK